MRDTYREFLEALADMGISLSDGQLAQFDRYYHLLLEWNEKMNLTAITDFTEVWQKHFLDSLTMIGVREISDPVTMIDVGTGAGFPGIPLKIVYPQIELTLLDSLNKRITFLNEVIRELGLTGVTAIHGRSEEIAKKPEYREQFDICVSRAVANLSTLSEYCLPFVKIGGCFISYKGSECKEELVSGRKAIRLLGGSVSQVMEFTVPHTDLGRTLILTEKEFKTPKKFPRKAGTPAKEPLK